MVCVAAFIVLVLLSFSLPVLRIFNKRAAIAIWRNLKAAWACVGRRITFRPCDTSFKQDIENSILKKVLRKNPKLVRPAKVAIEVVSVLIIVITVWSLLVVLKSGLSLYVYGTCDVREPSACSIGQVEACTIDSVSSSGFVVDWFTDWGNLFVALPARMTSWDAEQYIPENGVSYVSTVDSDVDESELPVAVDIFDPGCIVCQNSFKAQVDSGFMTEYRVYLIPYAIRAEDDGYRFTNSYLISQYIEAVRGYSDSVNEWMLAERLFTEKMPRTRRDHQDAFNTVYSAEEAEEVMLGWLRDAGLDDEAVDQLQQRAHSDEIANRLAENYRLVDDEIRTKRIPTMLYDGNRHEGVFEP